MSILVTGAAGYIGSHFLESAALQGREVVGIDNLSHGNRVPDSQTPFYVCDVGHLEKVRLVCESHNVDSVVHFAALKSVGDSIKFPELYFRENVQKTVELIGCLKDLEITRFVFSSSCSVYGTPTELPVTEQSHLSPESIYALTKATIDQYLAIQCNPGFRAISLRYFNAAGTSMRNLDLAEDWNLSGNLVPVACRIALTDSGVLEIFGDDYETRDGTCVRDYVHVDDLVDAHLKALDYLDNSSNNFTILNLGSGIGNTVKEVVSTIERRLATSIRKTIVGRRAGDPSAIYSNSSKARRLLGWEPAHNLESIVDSAIKSYAKKK